MAVWHSYMGFSTKVPGSWPGSGWLREGAHFGRYPEFTIQVPGSWPGSGWLRLIYMNTLFELFNIGVWLIFSVAAVKFICLFLFN